MKIVCPACGKETESGFMFCMMCGAKIGEIDTAPAAEEMKEEIAEAAAEVSAAAEEVITDADETIAEAVSDTVTEAETAVSEAVETVAEAETAVSGAAETVTEGMAEAEETVSESISNVTETVTEAAETVTETVAGAVPAANLVQTPSEPVPAAVQKPAEPAAPVSPIYGYDAGVYGSATVAVFPPSGTEEPKTVQPEVQPQQNYNNVYQQNTGYQQPYSQPYQQPYSQQPTYNGQYQQGYVPPYTTPYQQQAAPVKKKKLGFGRRVLAFFLCFVLFLCGLVSLLVFGIRKALSVENLTEAVVDASAIAKIDVSDLTGNKADKGKTVAAYILEQIPEEQRALYPEINEDNINELLNDKSVQKMISGTLDGFVEYLSGEEDEFRIDADKIVKILEDNADTIEQYTGKELKKEDYDAIRKEIDTFNEEEMANIPDRAGESFSKGMKFIRFFFSDTLLYILYGITGFFVLLVFLACGRFVDSSLIHVGVTGSLVGGLVFGGITIGRVAIEEFAENQIGEQYIEMLRKALFTHFEKAGLVVLCAGVGTIIIGIIWKIVRFSMSE
ncbi:MAG: hypothetical protein J5845_03020 [Lachnospiraceae bacterium]|nr:hypothetical protein [Lachnospiraceae bacterium]